ncbi:hypothetical protein DFH07DRAFT_849519 [Mycena maculata]|uniref:RING-type domain-containing protein n=1 Tax=Mycena maculata TaxID=230809 RepID=A0AAD7MSD4_9AGAR|nr:hypothetical protein DFH07DRAFT_849519 [Mycena maculata]
MPSPRRPLTNMSLHMPAYTPEFEYSLDLGALSTPLPEDNPPVLPRTRSWRALNHEADKQRSSAYDEAGNLKIAVRGRRAARDDCGICAERAASPVRTQCCGALFCRAHIHDWVYGPAATGLCPSCSAPCTLPSDRTEDNEKKRPRTPSPSPASFPTDTIRSSSSIRTATEAEAERVTSAGSHDSLVRLLSVLGLLLLFAVLSRRGEERLADFSGSV